MFGANFQRKYALTDQGVQNTKKGTFWTVIVNLVVMGGVGILYLVMSGLMETLTDGTALPADVYKRQKPHCAISSPGSGMWRAAPSLWAVRM